MTTKYSEYFTNVPYFSFSEISFCPVNLLWSNYFSAIMAQFWPLIALGNYKE